MTPSTGPPRTLVVGFDALDFRYLDRFSESLPNLSQLRERGVEASLASAFPPGTASAWPSLYTGSDPSHHGVYDFFTCEYPDEAEVVSRDDVDAPALWNYLSDAGHPSVVVNVPVTHPAEEVEGVLFPGLPAAEDEPSHPPAARDRLEAELGEPYRVCSLPETAAGPDETLEASLDVIDLRARAAAELLSEYEWRLGFVQVQRTDAVFRDRGDQEAFRRVYEAADDVLETVLDAVPAPVNVIVCSGHGMGRKQGYRIHVNELLREAGYLETTDGAEGPTLDETERRLLGARDADGRKAASARALAAVSDALGGLGLGGGRVAATAERVGMAGLLGKITPDAMQREATEAVDWRDSVAYCESASRFGVRLNVRGRDPEGLVPQRDYERVRGDVMGLLSRLETPDGRAAFDAVLRREDVYDGPHAEAAPDVLVTPRDADHALSAELCGRTFDPIDLYDREPDGVFVAAGPDIDTSGSVDRLDLTDVAPAVMTLLGQPVPGRMTGEVPPGLLTVDDELGGEQLEDPDPL